MELGSKNPLSSATSRINDDDGFVLKMSESSSLRHMI